MDDLETKRMKAHGDRAWWLGDTPLTPPPPEDGCIRCRQPFHVGERVGCTVMGCYFTDITPAPWTIHLVIAHRHAGHMFHVDEKLCKQREAEAANGAGGCLTHE